MPVSSKRGVVRVMNSSHFAPDMAPLVHERAFFIDALCVSLFESLPL
jgi:hypothetical protein